MATAQKPAASTAVKKPATSSATKKTTASTAAKKPAASAAAKKPTASSTAAKKPAATAAAKKPVASAAAKPAAAAKTTAPSTVKLTAAEKKLLEAYRAANQEAKDAAMAILAPEKEEESGNALVSLLSALADAQNGQQAAPSSGNDGGLLGTLLAGAGNASGGNGDSLLGSLLSGMASNTGNASSVSEEDNSGGGLASLLMGLLK